MERFESNQTEQSWFCYSIHFTGVNCRRQDFRTVPFLYLIRIYHSIHVDQVYREQYIRNTVKILLSRGRHVHLKTYKQQQQQQQRKSRECRCFERFSLGFLTDLSFFLFFFQLNGASANGLQFKSF